MHISNNLEKSRNILKDLDTRFSLYMDTFKEKRVSRSFKWLHGQGLGHRILLYYIDNFVKWAWQAGPFI